MGGTKLSVTGRMKRAEKIRGLGGHGFSVYYNVLYRGVGSKFLLVWLTKNFVKPHLAKSSCWYHFMGVVVLQRFSDITIVRTTCIDSSYIVSTDPTVSAYTHYIFNAVNTSNRRR